MSVRAVGIRPGPADPRAHARKIAELVADTWHDHHGSGQLEVPLAVVAALSLLSPPFGERREFAGELIDLDPDEFAKTVRHLWTCFLRMRPDLVNRVWLLAQPWVSETHGLSPEALRAAKAVGDAALRRDLFALTGTEARFEVDLLGVLLTQLRPHSALQARGQYYTPGDVSNLMARILDVTDGERVHEPCVGTGGNFRAAAWAMRCAGRDPATCIWVGVDIDAVAVACCAVNVVVWGLGYQVLLGVGDALVNDWWDRAVAERQETIALARDAALLTAIRRLGLAGDPAGDGVDEPAGAPPAEDPAGTEAGEPNPAGADDRPV